MIFNSLSEVVQSREKYNVIYADPPWPLPEGIMNPNGYRHKTLIRKEKYRTMGIGELKRSGRLVRRFSRPHAILCIWVVGRMLPECLEVIEAWGFKYNTVLFTWVKMQRKSLKNFHVAHGHTIQYSEMCLVATRGGDAGKVLGVVPQKELILACIGRHSEKPKEARRRIENMVPGARRIELFSRHVLPGWDSMGDEIAKQACPLDMGE